MYLEGFISSLPAFAPNYPVVVCGWQSDSEETRQFLLKTIISKICSPVYKKKSLGTDFEQISFRYLDV